MLLISGKLTATIGGQTFDLNEDDTLTYDATTPHWWTNQTKRPAVIMAVSTPPSLGRVH